MLGKTDGGTLGYVPVEQLLALLAPSQRTVYSAVREFWAKHNHGPTQQELYAMTRVTSIVPSLQRLERAGLIERTPNIGRGIRVVALVQVAGNAC